MPYTGDEVFWSGAMKRPPVGSQKQEYFAVEEPGKRTNQKVVNIVVDRLELAASGDMALEFSHSTLDCDGAGNTADQTKIDVAELRVWKKVTGEWKVSAFFARPLDIPFQPH